MQSEQSVAGVLVVDKPVGPTSHDVVACARRALGTRRVGHTGTLDPLASGVLPLVLGQATRLAQFLSGREKEYLATVRFGRTTDTYDAAGLVTGGSGTVPPPAAIERALEAFRGSFAQTPPPHSAKKIDGVRAYQHARAQRPVTLAAVPVTVSALELVELTPDGVRLRVECSAGFYVRSLAHDLGAALGTGGMLEALVRTRAGAFRLADAVPLAMVVPERRAEAEAAILPLERLLPELPAVQLTADGARRARQGQPVRPADTEPPGTVPDGPWARLFAPDGRLIGLARPGAGDGALHPSVNLG